jgi:DNA-binding GntR family transcriptional regulator
MSSNPDESVSRGNLRQQVTSRIMAGVFQGRFLPDQRLVVQHLSDLYQVSPTPVRESLVELASLGIVDLLPNRGAVVRPFGPREVREIGQIRRILEVEAARCACGRVAADELTAIERELARLRGLRPGPSWARDARAADSRLHGLIAASCDSTRLHSEIGRYVTLWRTLRDVSHQLNTRTTYAHAIDALSEHSAIVRALLMSDEEGAVQVMDRHIRSSIEVLEEIMFGAAESPPAAMAAG